MPAVRFLLALAIGLSLAPFAHAGPTATFTTSLLVGEGQTQLYHGSGLYYDKSIDQLSTVHLFTNLPSGEQLECR